MLPMYLELITHDSRRLKYGLLLFGVCAGVLLMWDSNAHFLHDMHLEPGNGLTTQLRRRTEGVISVIQAICQVRVAFAGHAGQELSLPWLLIIA